MANEDAWLRDDLVEYYATTETALRPPEAVILKALRAELQTMTMLDIGVGAGRTTRYFGPLVERYVGVDYSAKMIEACKRRFHEGAFAAAFEVCDARDLGRFDDGTFDFILFSLNGIDCVNADGRMRVFREVRRVGRAGGYFCFSSHNLQEFPVRFGLRRAFVPSVRRTLANLHRWALLHCVYNTPALFWRARHSPSLVVRDAVHNYGLYQYYIRPLVQMDQLSEWCDDVTAYSSVDGRQLDRGELARTVDPWVYYLCRIR